MDPWLCLNSVFNDGANLTCGREISGFWTKKLVKANEMFGQMRTSNRGSEHRQGHEAEAKANKERQRQKSRAHRVSPRQQQPRHRRSLFNRVEKQQPAETDEQHGSGPLHDIKGGP